MSNKYTFFENKILGKGLTSIVCEGIDNKTKEIIAAKIISKLNKIKNFDKYITNEIEILKFLNTCSNPNIIKLLDLFEDNKKYTLVFEYVPIKFDKLVHNIPYEKIFFYVKQLLEILVLLKNNNIIHNDIKPANILIKDDIVKLCDFGMAEFLEKDVNSIKGFVCGSPIYMDLSKMNGIHSYESDFWCFKLIYYEMVYHRHPFSDIKKKEHLKIKLEQLKTNLFDNITFYLDKNPHTEILKRLFSNKITSPNELLDCMNTVILDKTNLIPQTDEVYYECEENEENKSASESEFYKIEKSNISLSIINISKEISTFDIDDCHQFILI